MADAEYGRHQLLRASGGAPVILAVGTGLMVPGYTLIVDEAGAPDLYARLINKVCLGCCHPACCMAYGAGIALAHSVHCMGKEHRRHPPHGAAQQPGLQTGSIHPHCFVVATSRA